MPQIPDLIADNNVALLLDGLKYLATLLVGGWVGYRWKLQDMRRGLDAMEAKLLAMEKMI